jgi:DNA-directed RNA polymerase specialized sigma24 family protein
MITLETRPAATTREISFKKLYESVFPAVARFVAKRKGSLEDATDIFHDALIIFYEKTSRQEFVLQTNEEAYIMGIVKHLWLRKHNSGHSVTFSDVEMAVDIPDDYFPSVNTSRLLTFLESVGEKCLALLRAFYFENKRVPEIQKAFRFSSEHSTSVQKYKCIEKLRESAKQKTDLYESFFE